MLVTIMFVHTKVQQYVCELDRLLHKSFLTLIGSIGRDRVNIPTASRSFNEIIGMHVPCLRILIANLVTFFVLFNLHKEYFSREPPLVRCIN